MWQEVYLSAILRSILYSDDSAYWLDAYRKVDPITTPESELRFLQAADPLRISSLSRRKAPFACQRCSATKIR